MSKMSALQAFTAKGSLTSLGMATASLARIHVDYAGPFMGKMFLLVVDTHSKWMEVAVVTSATTQSTIEKLRVMFATHGLPDILVSDNGTAFTSTEFMTFTKRNGIRHIRTAPYNPSSNGQVERAVQTFRETMKKTNTGSIETMVSRFLFHYRITPHSTTGVSPADRGAHDGQATQVTLKPPSPGYGGSSGYKARISEKRI